MAELLRLFFGLPESQVVEIRDSALAKITKGEVIMEVTGGGKTGKKLFSMPPKEILFEANAALRHLNPAVYGRRVRKTYANFRQRYE